MKFTDDDLKRLREQMWNSPFNEEMILDLLARLEAAEICLEKIIIAAPELIDMGSYKEWKERSGK